MTNGNDELLKHARDMDSDFEYTKTHNGNVKKDSRNSSRVNQNAGNSSR